MRAGLGFRVWDLWFLSDFGFRASDLAQSAPSGRPLNGGRSYLGDNKPEDFILRTGQYGDSSAGQNRIADLFLV
jgi:hypothetical protein